MTRIFIANLRWGTTEREIFDMFSKHGEVLHVDLKVDATGKSKGFGWLTLADDEGVIERLRALTLRDGTRILRVELARSGGPRQDTASVA